MYNCNCAGFYFHLSILKLEYLRTVLNYKHTLETWEARDWFEIHWILFTSEQLWIAMSLNGFHIERYLTQLWKPWNQEIDIDYDRSHQSHLWSHYKPQRQNWTFSKFLPFMNTKNHICIHPGPITYVDILVLEQLADLSWLYPWNWKF